MEYADHKYYIINRSGKRKAVNNAVNSLQSKVFVTANSKVEQIVIVKCVVSSMLKA